RAGVQRRQRGPERLLGKPRPFAQPVARAGGHHVRVVPFTAKSMGDLSLSLCAFGSEPSFNSASTIYPTQLRPGIPEGNGERRRGPAGGGPCATDLSAQVS